MGTPDFAVAILDTLIKNSYNVVGVITAPDKPAGRGRKLNESAIKKYAIENKLTILQPTNLKDPSFLAVLKALEANLQIVVAFRMLPKVVWQMPKYGTFNLHASLLPEYRGAAPINWAIINGETKTGVTTFFIDDKIDTGEIILQEETPIYPTENAGSLHDRLMVLGAEVVLKTVKRIESGNFNTTAQAGNQELKLAYKIHKDTCKIDWCLPIEKIYNFIRGLSPYPSAWTTLHIGDDSLLMKIYEVGFVKEPHNLNVGEVISDKKEMKVAVKEGYINLLEIQIQGKRRMTVKEVLNGLDLGKNAQVS